MFLGTGTTTSPTTLSTKEGTFETHLEEIYVIHKNNIRAMSPKEVGDGLLIPIYISEAHTYISHLAQDGHLGFAVLGACIYQRFDETTGATKAYAYGTKKNDIAFKQEMLTRSSLHLTLSGGKFVEITGYTHDLQNTSALLQDISDAGDIVQILAYLLGVAMLYGHWTIKEETLIYLTISLPLVESIVIAEPYILEYIQILHQHQLYITHSYQETSTGQLLTLQIADTQILEYMGKHVGLEPVDHSHIRTLLQDYLPQKDFGTHGDSVLKLLHT